MNFPPSLCLSTFAANCPCILCQDGEAVVHFGLSIVESCWGRIPAIRILSRRVNTISCQTCDKECEVVCAKCPLCEPRVLSPWFPVPKFPFMRYSPRRYSPMPCPLGSFWVWPCAGFICWGGCAGIGCLMLSVICILQETCQTLEYQTRLSFIVSQKD